MRSLQSHREQMGMIHGQVPTKGLLATQRFALGAIFVYQLALLYRLEQHLEFCVGLSIYD
jgi:hypothetical protein